MTRAYEKAEQLLAELRAEGFNLLEIYQVSYHLQFHLEHDYGLKAVMAAAEKVKKEVPDES